jgi:hypothetical protein
MSAETPITFLEATCIGLGEYTYQWISIKRFSTAIGTSPNDLLAELLKTREYQDVYTSPDERKRTPSGHGHGPYRLECIGTSDFVRLDPEVAEGIVHEYAARYNAPGKALSDIESLVIAPISRSSEIWQLPELRDAENIVALAGILRDFQELVVLDDGKGELFLIVMAGD